MKRMTRLAALVLTLSLLLTGCGTGGGGAVPRQAVALAAAVQNALYPNEELYLGSDGSFDGEGYDRDWQAWWEEAAARAEASEQARGALDAFFSAFTAAALAESGNQVISPVNLYLALAMLAECTGGETRAELLDLLGAGDLDTLRDRTDAIWRSQHYDDGRTTSLFSASLWLEEGIAFNQDTLEDLALRHRADSYSGDLGSQEMNTLLQTWLSDHTGGLLKEAAGQVELDPDTVLALATAVCFKGSWLDEFPQSQTRPQTFHAPEGDLETDFMRRSDTMTYYREADFSAVFLPLSGGERMWLVLPEEGVSPRQLLERGDVQAFLLSGGETAEQSRPLVHLELPKFDVTQSLNLIPTLKALGITRVFEGGDFSPVFAQDLDAALTQATHAARVKIDEKGLEAAAFTVLAVSETAAELPAEELTLTLDRPFLFSLSSAGDLPLFTGVVERPAGQ